ncbi:helix-turn-helix domain-containing protein, partial [Xanthomonas oryzae]
MPGGSTRCRWRTAGRIADALERAPSTISRELRRNQHAARYRPDHAQR